GIVTMEIPMRDIFSFEETSATGTVTITIDANTGEACALTSTSNVSGPYAAHIHLGSYPERGPIVVDFQPMNDGVEQCSANDLTDINEVLSDRTEYYAEMHDVAGNYTIRGQLSEATSFEDLRDPALIPVDDDGTAGFDTDPSQSGAVVRFEGSSLLAQGVVADQAIVDQLISSLEASGVPVINELRVEVGAPLPSGRFVANEGLTFPVGSDQLQGDNTAVLSAMVAVIQANPGWKLTVVGHTDDTGTRTDNLELSRRRANSVRTALEALGVDTDVLKVAGFGPDQPVADNATAEGRQRNRRIEFIIDPT
ncbi:MAG: OmpA family protein, partial [Acidimicrobiia bacterium]|nr:OmpA family protein [Acidimicrobiia bacterium]